MPTAWRADDSIDDAAGPTPTPTVEAKGYERVRSTDALLAFERLLADRGLSPQDLDAVSAVDAMLHFYLKTRFVDVEADDDSDMLLFQWGTFDSGSSFYYDITRQLITMGSCDDDAMSHLSLVLDYDADRDALDIRPSNRWCRRPMEESPEELQWPNGDGGVSTFREFIRDSPATEYVRGRTPRAVRLQFGGV